MTEKQKNQIEQRAIQRLNKTSRVELIKNIGAALIALNEQGWGQIRIVNLLDEVQNVWNETARDEKRSLLMIMEEETGIELKESESGKSYHEVDYLSGRATPRTMTPAEYFYMQAQQRRWLGTLALASVFLSLYRLHDWGGTRLQRLVDRVNEIKAENKGNATTIRRKCHDLTGVDIVQHLEIFN